MLYNSSEPMIKIRNMNETDIPPLLDLIHEIGKELTPDIYYVDSDEFIIGHYKNRERGFIKVAEFNNTFAGYCLIQFPSEEENLGNKAGVINNNSIIAHIESLGVSKKFRGHGLQKLLISNALAELRRMGVEKAYCTVSPDNKYSLRNFIEIGFIKIAEKELYGGYKRLILTREV
jgi:ribosomal protein S18 acetylase RimI-like enzyme